MKHRGRLLFAASCIVFLVGCGGTQRVYEGEKRPLADVARVYNSNGVQITSIDGIEVAPPSKLLWDDRWKTSAKENTSFDLLPGRHRLTVWLDRFESQEQTYDTMIVTRLQAQNQMSLVYDFEAGKKYEFAVEIHRKGVGGGPTGEWKPLLIERGTDKIVAGPEDTPAVVSASAAPFARATPAASTGASVSGVARLTFTDGTVVTSAGRDVLLLPRTPENLQWFEQRVAGGRIKDHPLDRSREMVLQRSGRFTLGYGTGQFEFTDVPPGQYVAFFQASHAGYTWFPRADVTVTPGQRRVEAGYLAVPSK